MLVEVSGTACTSDFEEGGRIVYEASDGLRDGYRTGILVHLRNNSTNSTITVLSNIAFKLDVDLGLLRERCARSMGPASTLTETRLADHIKAQAARLAHTTPATDA